MHVNEVEAFAARVGADKAFAGKRVVIRAPKDKGGLYISRRGRFDAEKKDAFVYDYERDRVGDQLFQCMSNGMLIEVELA